MKLRRLKSHRSDKIGQKIADFRIQINLLTDEVQELKDRNEKLFLFETLISGIEDNEFYLLDIIDKLRKLRRDKKTEISIQ